MTIYFIVSKSQKQSVVHNNLTIIVGEGVSRVGSGVDSRGNSMDSGVGGRYVVGNSVVSNSSGRDQSTTMSIVDSSHHSSGGLSMSNLLKGVRFGLSLAIGVDKRIAGVDTSNMGNYAIGISRVDTGSMGKWNNTNCLDTSLNLIDNFQ